MDNNKTVVIGDLHGRSEWKLILYKENPSKVIFVGDYFDSFDLSAAIQLFNYNEIIKLKEENKIEVVLLIGNHDLHYFPEIGHNGTSGYQHNHAYQIGDAIDRSRNHLRMAHQIDNILFTHAGFSPVWLESIFGKGYRLEEGQTYADLINDIWKYKPKTFCFFTLGMVCILHMGMMNFNHLFGLDQNLYKEQLKKLRKKSYKLLDIPNN